MPNKSVWLEHYRDAGGYTLRFPRLADFCLNHSATRAKCWPSPGTTADTIDHLFGNQVLPLAVAQQGWLALHGSAVCIDGVAVAFLGESGRGKSTLAAYFATHGAPFLTDDGLFVDLKASHAIAHPGHQSIRLWSDSKLLVAARGAEALQELGAPQYSSKGRFAANPELPHESHARRLRCIFLLAPPDSSREVRISQVPAASAFVQILTNSFLLDTASAESNARHFAQMKSLLDCVPVFELNYPRAFEQLGEVEQAVHSLIQSLVSSVVQTVRSNGPV